jgi:S1-C subfamily serine protease
MTFATASSTDRLVLATCPNRDCAARLRIAPKSTRSNVTCANCGHRFVLDLAKRGEEPAGSLDFPREPIVRRHRRSRGQSRLGPIVAGVVALLLLGGIIGGVFAFRAAPPDVDTPVVAGETAAALHTNPTESKVSALAAKSETTAKTATTAKAMPKSEPPPIITPPPPPPNRDDVLARVKQSTVLIEEKGKGWGTGFVIRPGIVMTNAHVVCGLALEKMMVSFVSIDNTDPPKLKPTLLYVDVRRDLAILRVKSDRPALELTASGTELSGLEVAVVGNPRGDAGQAEINKVTTGKLSAPIRRDAGQTFYELSAPAFFGNSGGPVVDVRTGKLVGVMQSILDDGKSKSYCIPFNEALQAVKALPADAKDEAKALKIAAGRHALGYLATKLPELEKNASRAMEVQCILLRIGAQGPNSLYKMPDGSVLSKTEILAVWREVFQELKEPLAELMKTIETRVLPAIKASPKIPGSLKDQAMQRVAACEQMRRLASSTTNTEKAFQKHMDAYRAASLEAVKKFEAGYAAYLDATESRSSVKK